MTKLNNETPIKVWRTEKERLDVSVKEILGCVGEPLAAFIPDTVEGRAAATEARYNLVSMINEQRESAAEAVVQDIHDHLENCDESDMRSELDIDDSLCEAANKAFAHACWTVSNVSWDVDIDDSDL